MAFLREINTCEVPLLLRELTDNDEDPALTSARNKYQQYLERLKEPKPVERVTNIKRRITNGR